MNPYNQGFGQSGYTAAQQPMNAGGYNQPYGQQQQFGSNQFMPQQGGMAQQGMPQQGMPQGGMLQQGMPQVGMPQQQGGFPPSGMPQQQMQQGQMYGGQGGQNIGYPHWMQQTSFQAPQNQLQQWFQSADVNKDGSINLLELQAALGYSGQQFSAGTIRAMFEMFDIDRNGVLNFQEFLAVYNYIIQMKQAYEQFNRSGAGLTMTDAQSAVGTHRGLGSMSGISQMIPSLFPLFDKTGSGKLDLNGFLKMACYLGKIMTSYEKVGVMGAMGSAMGGGGGMMSGGGGMMSGMSGMSQGMHMGGMNTMGGYPPSGMGMMGMNQMGGYPSGGMGGQQDIMSIGSQVVNQLMGKKGKKDKKVKKEKKH